MEDVAPCGGGSTYGHAARCGAGLTIQCPGRRADACSADASGSLSLVILGPMPRSTVFRGVLAVAILLLPAAPAIAETSLKELFTDPQDGAFDMSRFIKTRTGFVPIVAPVTEPALGYGAAGGVVFFHRREGGPTPDPGTAGGGRLQPPASPGNSKSGRCRSSRISACGSPGATSSPGCDMSSSFDEVFGGDIDYRSNRRGSCLAYLPVPGATCSRAFRAASCVSSINLYAT